VARPLARPTLACLEGDLRRKDPGASVPLDTIDHPILNEARDELAKPRGDLKPVQSIDDNALWKLKHQRSTDVPWRGAGYLDTEDGDRPWVVAAGARKAGSKKDFYEQLNADCERRRKQLNAASTPSPKKTSSDHLLPTAADHQRLVDETVNKDITALEATIPNLVLTAAASPGTPVTGQYLQAEVKVLIDRDEHNELYVAVSVAGYGNLHAVVLDMVPGVDLIDEAGDPSWEALAPEESPFGEPREHEIIWWTPFLDGA
jgi:hypothetical protein